MRLLVPLALLFALLAAAPARAASPVCGPATMAASPGATTLALDCTEPVTATLVAGSLSGPGTVTETGGDIVYENEGGPALASFAVDVTTVGGTARLPVQVGYQRASRPSCGLPAPFAVRPAATVTRRIACRDSSSALARAVVVEGPRGASVGSPDAVNEYRFVAGNAELADGSFTLRAADSELVTQRFSIDQDANAVPQCVTPPTTSVRPQSLRRLPLSCSDADGDALRVEVVSDPSGSVDGITQATGAGSAAVDFEAPAAEGDYDVTFRAVDDRSASPEFRLHVVVDEAVANLTPTCDDRVVPAPGGQTEVTATSNCTDDERNALTYAVGATRGVTVLRTEVAPSGEARFSMRVDAAYTGIDQGFDYTATDRFGDAATGRVRIGDLPPSCVAPAQAPALRSGRFVTVDLGALCQRAVTFAVDTSASRNGQIAAPPVNGRVKFQASQAARDGDVASLRFTAANDAGTSEPVTVRFTTGPSANNAPTCASPGTVNARLATSRTITLVCEDPDGDRLSAAIDAQAASGTATVGSGLQLTYRSRANLAPPVADGFTVTVTDALGARVPVAVAVTVQPTAFNTPPSCELSVPVSPRVQTTRSVELRCHDDEDDPVTQVTVGTVTNGELPGTFAAAEPGRFVADFTAGAVAGPAGFDYVVRDAGGSRQESAALDVLGENANTAPQCETLVVEDVAVGTPVTIDPASTCRDAEGDPFEARLFGAPRGNVGRESGKRYSYTAVDAGTETVEFAVRDTGGATGRLLVTITATGSAVEPEPTVTPGGGTTGGGGGTPAGDGGASGGAAPGGGAGAGTGGGAAGGAGTPGGGGPADTTAPAVTVRVGKGKLKPLVKRGLPVTVACSETCTTTVVVTLPGKVARKLRLARSARKPVAIARTAGTGTLKLRLSSRLLRLRRVPITVTVLATDPAGNRATATARATLRR